MRLLDKIFSINQLLILGLATLVLSCQTKTESKSIVADKPIEIPLPPSRIDTTKILKEKIPADLVNFLNPQLAKDSLLKISILELPSKQNLEVQIKPNIMDSIWNYRYRKHWISRSFVFTVVKDGVRIPKLGTLIQTEHACDTCNIKWLYPCTLEGAKTNKYKLFEVDLTLVSIQAHSVSFNNHVGDKIGYDDWELELACLFYEMENNPERINELKSEIQRRGR